MKYWSDLMNNGWIPIHRQLQEHWLWEDKPFSKGQAWIDLLMLANYKDTKVPYKGEIISCKTGGVQQHRLNASTHTEREKNEQVN